MTMVPLRIRFELASPLAAFDKRPTYFDGLLSGIYGEELLARAPNDQVDDPLREALELGRFLDFVDVDVERVWKASRLIPAWSGPLHWWTMTRKTDPLIYKWGQDVGLIKSNRSSVDLFSGQERNFFWYLPIRRASHVDAWCVGDKERLQSLLSSVRAIGKHRNNGFGVVSAVHVEEDETAAVKWRWRPLPDAGEADKLQDPAVEYANSFEAIRPPYWDTLARKNCRVPLLF